MKRVVLRVKLYGDGSVANPYRSVIPTHNLIMGNISKGWALISVPDDVLGLVAVDYVNETQDITTEGPHIQTLSPVNVSKIQNHLVTAYPGLVGIAKVELV